MNIRQHEIHAPNGVLKLVELVSVLQQQLDAVPERCRDNATIEIERADPYEPLCNDFDLLIGYEYVGQTDGPLFPEEEAAE